MRSFRLAVTTAVLLLAGGAGSASAATLSSGADPSYPLTTGGDDVDCGRASDIALAPAAADHLEPRCEVASFGHFTAGAYPVKHRRLPSRLPAPQPEAAARLDADPRARRRRRALAYRTIHRSARTCRMYPKRGFTVELDLTSLGRRMASRHKGVHSTVEIRGRSFRDVDWTLELHNR